MLRLLVAALLLSPASLLAQNRSSQLVEVARSHIVARALDSAVLALEAALDDAGYPMDSARVYIWYGLVEHLRGRGELARLSVRRALLLNSDPAVDNLEEISPSFAELYDRESRSIRVYWTLDVDQMARWRVGPLFVYPPELRSRRVAGHALLRAVVDTSGQIVETTIEVLETPDSALIAPLRRMLLAASFTPAHKRGKPVRSWISYQFNIAPPVAKNPVRLVDAARHQLDSGRPDSALALLREALDSANGATPASRLYALAVQGMAFQANGNQRQADSSISAARKSYRELTAQGVDLAPFLRRLLDGLARMKS